MREKDAPQGSSMGQGWGGLTCGVQQHVAVVDALRARPVCPALMETTQGQPHTAVPMGAMWGHWKKARQQDQHCQWEKR